MTRSRINVPQSRLAPKEVIQRLREIDPMAELLYMGEGVWALGVYAPQRIVQENARKRLAMLSREPNATASMIRWERAHAEGFRPITSYKIHGSPDGYIVNDFELRDFKFRMRREAEFQRQLKESSGDAASERNHARMQDAISSTAGDIYRHAFKKPIMITQ